MIDLGQIKDIDTLRNVFFGVCDTYPEVATKVVTAPGYTPAEGTLLVVKFNYVVNLWDSTNEEWVQLYMNVNGSGPMYAETYTYTYTYPDGAERYYELMGGTVQTPVYAVFTYYEIASDDKGYRLVGTSGTLSMLGEMFDRMSAMSGYISGKQDTLVSGTNIRTVNGNTLLGSGDLSLSGKIFQGVTYSASSETTKVVTINSPANATFENGDLLLLRFYNDVAANVTGTTISIGPKTYGIAYRSYGLQAAGVIKAGDNVLLYCSNWYAHIIAIDRWGADIASKQDALPPVANNAGKVLAVNSAANGMEWADKFTPRTSHTLLAETQTVTLTCAAGERAMHIVVISPSLPACTVNIDIRNNADNIVFLAGQTDVQVNFLIDGSTADNVIHDNNAYLIERSGLLYVPLSKIENAKIFAEAIGNDVYVDSAWLSVYTPTS